MTEQSQLPSGWKEILRRCNFYLARREVGTFFQFVNRKGKAEGGEYVFPKAMVEYWDMFADAPRYDTAVELLEHWPTLFTYFEGSCPGGQFYRSGTSTAKAFLLGHYRVGMSASDIAGLRELSREEYAFLQRRFKGEAIFHAPPAQFLGRVWKMKVGILGARLWKLAGSLEIHDQEEMVELMRSAYSHCELLLGTPSEEQQGLQVWDTSDGNVILQVASALDSYMINLFVTDGDAVRSAKRTWKTMFGLD